MKNLPEPVKSEYKLLKKYLRDNIKVKVHNHMYIIEIFENENTKFKDFLKSSGYFYTNNKWKKYFFKCDACNNIYPYEPYAIVNFINRDSLFLCKTCANKVKKILKLK